VLARTHPYLDVPRPIGMAHRGFSTEGLENTMVAFEAAVALGMTHVETDVHATRDGVLVAFHDLDLDRVTDGSGGIAEACWADLRTVRVGGREPIPLLEDVLGTWPHLRVNIDVKDWPAVTPRSVRAAHRQGLQVHVWTVNDEAEMDRLLDLGVDGLISDRADTLARVLSQRGSQTA
jgi:glycerophosphoryl diester phosphodiesterase